MTPSETTELFAHESIKRILFKLAPPVMLAQTIQAFYSIVDCLFIGRASETALTALSIVFPLQLLMLAFAVGAGVGVNTLIAAKLGEGDERAAREYAGVATPLALVMWVLFAVATWFFMPQYAAAQTNTPLVIRDVLIYGRFVCVGSFGIFLESMWTKILQAEGNMRLPTVAQIVGALVNIALDPILIFGLLGAPRLGLLGAAIATVIGQVVAALIVMKGGWRASPSRRVYPHAVKNIFRIGAPNILMQAAYTLYIFGLNMILATFCDQAVTALGIYYKWQTLVFIPLGAMQTCIVPVVSFNYAARSFLRCKQTVRCAVVTGWLLMSLGTLAFIAIPEQLLRVFTTDELVVEIGRVEFFFVGLSFFPLVTSLTYPVFFQAVGASMRSAALTILRTVVLFVPLAYLFSRFGLNWFWLTFPVTDGITSLVGFVLYRRFFKKDARAAQQKRLAA